MILAKHPVRSATLFMGIAVLTPLGLANAMTPPDPPTSVEDAEPTPSSSPSLDERIQQARALYIKGQALFDTARYEDAADVFGQAYEATPDVAETLQIRKTLIYNIATTLEFAYDIDHDIEHLRRASRLMAEWNEAIPIISSSEDEMIRLTAEADVQMKRLSERLAFAELSRQQERETKRPTARPTPNKPENTSGTVIDEPRSSPARSMTVAGATLLGLGAASLGVMTAGIIIGARANDELSVELSTRRDQIQQGELGNALAIAGATTAAATIISGGVLLGLGIHRQRNPRTALSGWLDRRSGGVKITGRF